MGFGAGLFLAAIGAILTFAVNWTAKGFNIHTIGVILMIVGVLGIILDLVVFAPRRRTVSTSVAQPVARQTVVERDTYV